MARDLEKLDPKWTIQTTTFQSLWLVWPRQVQNWQHWNCADGTPPANLWLTQVGAKELDLERFAA